MYLYKTHKLKNNLKILRLLHKETKIVYLQIYMKLGHDLETKSQLEISHFIEHLFSMFTSTKYPDGKKNREEISFRNIDLDAETSEKYMRFVLCFHKKQTEFVFNLVSNALLDFKIDESMFKQEQNAVVEELNDIIRDTDYNFNTKIDSVIYKTHQRSFTQNNRLANTKKLKPKDIYKYYKKYFVSQNFVVGLFGDISKSNLLLLYNILEKIPSSEKNIATYKNEKISMSQKLVYYKKKGNVSNLRLVIKAPTTMFDKEYLDLVALNNILTGDLNALLLKVLRNEKGLVYSCYGEHEIDQVSKQLSFFTINTLCNTKNLLKVINLTVDVFKTIKTSYIDKKYIETYKSDIDMIKENRIICKKPDYVLERYSNYMIWDKPIVSFNKNYILQKNITQEILLNLSNRLFNKENLIICYDGEKQLNKEINKIINTL